MTLDKALHLKTEMAKLITSPTRMCYIMTVRNSKLKPKGKTCVYDIKRMVESFNLTGLIISFNKKFLSTKAWDNSESN